MKVLCMPWVTAGHVTPLLEVTRSLRERGHEITFATETSIAALTREDVQQIVYAGFDTERAFRAANSNEALVACFEACARNAIPALLDIVAREKPDVCLVGTTCVAGAIVCRSLRLPWVSLSTTPSEMRPMYAQAAQTQIALKTLPLHSDVNSVVELVRSPHLHLLPWPEDLVVAGNSHNSSSSYRHLGFVGSLPYKGTKQGVLAAPSSLSFDAESDNLDFWSECVAHALSDLVEVESTLALGSRYSTFRPEHAAQVKVVPQYDAQTELPRARCVVSMGGWGTISRCLTGHIPLVLTPFQLDQDDTAQLVVNSRYGSAVEVVQWDDLEPESLAAAIRRLLARAEDIVWPAIEPANSVAAEAIAQRFF